MMDSRKRILAELAFFLALVLVSEICRHLVKRHRPDSNAVQGLLVCTLVLLWYTVSITLILFNKWILSHWRDGLPFPIFYTTSHMFLKGVFSSSYLVCVRCKRLPPAGRKAFLGASFVGVMTGLDVAASNLSLHIISVSFFTMLKSASLVFILLVGVAARLEVCSWDITGTVIAISAGILIMTHGEADFDVWGFSLVIGSEVCASLRWIATQILLKDNHVGAMGAVLYMSPASTLSLLPLSLILEWENLAKLRDSEVAREYCVLVLLPGFLAFILLLVEVQLVKETSSLTLSVFGNLKSIVTILLSIVIFRERTSWEQWLGLSVALLGMLAYSHVKKKHHHVDALANLGYEMLGQDELDMGSSPSAQVKHNLDLEDSLQDSPTAQASSLPHRQEFVDAPSPPAISLGKAHTELAASGARDDEDRADANLDITVSGDHVPAASAYESKSEVSVAPVAPDAGSSATPAQSSARGRGKPASHSEERSADGGTSDNSGGSWCLEDGGSSLADQGDVEVTIGGSSAPDDTQGGAGLQA